MSSPDQIQTENHLFKKSQQFLRKNKKLSDYATFVDACMTVSVNFDDNIESCNHAIMFISIIIKKIKWIDVEVEAHHQRTNSIKINMFCSATVLLWETTFTFFFFSRQVFRYDTIYTVSLHMSCSRMLMMLNDIRFQSCCQGWSIYNIGCTFFWCL